MYFYLIASVAALGGLLFGLRHRCHLGARLLFIPPGHDTLAHPCKGRGVRVRISRVAGLLPSARQVARFTSLTEPAAARLSWGPGLLFIAGRRVVSAVAQDVNRP